MIGFSGGIKKAPENYHGAFLKFRVVWFKFVFYSKKLASANAKPFLVQKSS